MSVLKSWNRAKALLVLAPLAGVIVGLPGCGNYSNADDAEANAEYAAPFYGREDETGRKIQLGWIDKEFLSRSVLIRRKADIASSITSPNALGAMLDIFDHAMGAAAAVFAPGSQLSGAASLGASNVVVQTINGNLTETNNSAQNGGVVQAGGKNNRAGAVSADGASIGGSLTAAGAARPAAGTSAAAAPDNGL